MAVRHLFFLKSPPPPLQKFNITHQQRTQQLCLAHAFDTHFLLRVSNSSAKKWKLQMFSRSLHKRIAKTSKQVETSRKHALIDP